MIRSCFNVASSLSLLLGCVIATAWAFGRGTPRALEFGFKGLLWQVMIDAGRLRIDNEPQCVFVMAETERLGRLIRRHVRIGGRITRQAKQERAIEDWLGRS